MNHFRRWIVFVAALLLVVAVGGIAYDAGLSHGVAQGIEQSGKIVTPPGGAHAYGYPYPYFGWHRPWGFGFFFAPLLFIAFWVLVVRGLFWRRGGWYGGYGPGCGGRGEARLDEWHRRAHERMGEPLAGAPTEP